MLFLYGRVSYAQEVPAFTTPLFDTTESHRQNVCDRQALLHNGTVLLRDALTGFALRPALYIGDFFSLNNETGAIDEERPGLIVELLDELAKRGGFTWRDSFGVFNYKDMEKNRTFDELLKWTVDTYDLSCNSWSSSIGRINQGVTFLQGWYDGSIILVGKQETTDKVNVWSFLMPFAWGVWLMMFVTIVFSGFVYYWMEWYNEDSDRQDLGKMPTENIYFAALSFIGQIQFMPATDYARIFTLSCAFWGLLMASAYTANLASFLVANNTPSLAIASVGDAVSARLPICVKDSSVSDTLVTDAHPGAILVPKRIEDDIFFGVNRGECTLALTNVGTWDNYKERSVVNGNCQLDWIGRVFKFIEAGFASLSDSGTLCSSLIKDVLNVHLAEMKEDGFIEEAWQRHLERTSDIKCTTATQDTDSDSSQLSLQDMGGLFIIHYMVTALAICMAVFTKWNKKRKLKEIAKRSGDIAIANVAPGGPKTVEDGTVGAGKGIPVDMYQKQSEQLTQLSSQMRDILALMNDLKNESDERRGEYKYE